MKKIMTYALLLAMLMVSTAFSAEETVRDLVPESGAGWLVAVLEGVEYEWVYVDAVPGIGDVTYVFEGDAGPLQIKFNKNLAIGEAMAPNGIRTADFTSKISTSSGYYSVTKSTNMDVESMVLLEKAGEGGSWQGTFTLVVTPTDRTVADVRPGILESLTFENGVFCFSP